MKTIIAATDFTPSSNNACRYAAMLAQKFNTRLTIFNLYLAPVVHTNAGVFGLAVDSEKKNSEVRSRRLAAEIGKEHPDLQVDIFTRAGSFEEEIEIFTRKHSVVAVVMGLQTKTRISRFIYGSHGVNIAGKIDSPVIIVPEKYKEHRLQKMLLAVDHRGKLQQPFLKHFEKFIALADASVDLLHVRTPDELISEEMGAVNIRGVEHEIRVQHAKDLQEGITGYAKAHDTDLVTIVSRKHSVLYNFFAESNTKKIAFVSRIPVMAVHE